MIFMLHMQDLQLGLSHNTLPSAQVAALSFQQCLPCEEFCRSGLYSFASS